MGKINWRLALSQSKGFTLIELLVVISIIGILSSIGLTSFSKSQSKARDAKRLSDAKEIRTALEMYQQQFNSYPNTGGGWEYSAGWGGAMQSLQTQGFLFSLPKDPKNVGSPELYYYYNSDRTNYCIQISQENDATSNPNYWGYWGLTWKLRYGDRSYCSSH